MNLLGQAAPGQINDCYNDLIALGLNIPKAAFANHNVDQLIPVKLSDEVTIILAPEALVNGNISYKGSVYSIDHLKLETSLVSKGNAPVDAIGDAIQAALDEYVDSYYASGLSTIYKTHDGYAIYIVSNSYNPANYWYHNSNRRAGRWRGAWRLSHQKLGGKVAVQVHYYEDGNVQLNSTKTFESNNISLDPSEIGQSIVKYIQKSDTNFQTAINNTFTESGVTTFKNLRRALPVTRSKIEWSSILAYKVGEELKNPL